MCMRWNITLGLLALNDTVRLGNRKKYMRPWLGIVIEKSGSLISVRDEYGHTYQWYRVDPFTDQDSVFVCRRATDQDIKEYSSASSSKASAI